MHEVVTVSLLVSLVHLFIAITVFAGVLRWFDSLSQIPFVTARRKIDDDPLAAALYLGLRLVGVACLVGFILG